jgi:5'-nucleotidase/UDP-sugar diphosphatase
MIRKGKPLIRTTLKIFITVLLFLLILTIGCGTVFAAGKGSDKPKEITIDFTGNTNGMADEFDAVGGYVKAQKDTGHTVFYLDTGNFENSAPYRLVSTKDAPGIQILRSAGCDAIAPGKTELGKGAVHFTSMVRAAGKNLDENSGILLPNAKVSARANKTLAENGARDYFVVERGGVKLGVTLVLGKSVFKGADGFRYSDYLKHLKTVLAEMEEEDPDFVVVLADLSDAELKRVVQNIDGIDLIINNSDHSETAEVNGIRIATNGESGELNQITFRKTGEEWTYRSFKATSISGITLTDRRVSTVIRKMKAACDEGYFEKSGLRYSEILTENNVLNGKKSDIGAKETDDPYGNLIADSYRWAFRRLSNGSREKAPVIAAVSPDAVYGSIAHGNLTTADTFWLMAGKNGEGEAKSRLVTCYLTGKEMKSLAELNSDNRRKEEGKRFCFSGLRYRYNVHRVVGARVFDVTVKDRDGSWHKIDEDRLYCIVADAKTMKQIAEVSFNSSSVLKILPKDSSGKQSQVYRRLVIRKSGTPLRAWAALGNYLNSFGGSGIPSKYHRRDGRIISESSFSLSVLLEEPNKTMWFGFGLAAVILLIIVVFVVLVFKLVKGENIKRK